jgi:two-component system sensor histidine kinase BaeS
MPPHGWRTQFWVIDQDMRTLVGPRAPIPPDGTRRAIKVNNATSAGLSPLRWSA